MVKTKQMKTKMKTLHLLTLNVNINQLNVPAIQVTMNPISPGKKEKEEGQTIRNLSKIHFAKLKKAVSNGKIMVTLVKIRFLLMSSPQVETPTQLK